MDLELLLVFMQSAWNFLRSRVGRAGAIKICLAKLSRLMQREATIPPSSKMARNSTGNYAKVLLCPTLIYREKASTEDLN